MKGAFGQVIGKTIKHVYCRENATEPTNQIFLVFDDDTYFEIYTGGCGCSLKGAKGVDPGDIHTVRGLGHGAGVMVIDEGDEGRSDRILDEGADCHATKTSSLDTGLVTSFISKFDEVWDMSGEGLDEDNGWKYAIASMIGELRTHIPTIDADPAASDPWRVDLTTLLENKFYEWEEDRSFDKSIKPAWEVIYDAIDLHELNAYRFSIGDNREAMAAIENLREVLDYELAWSRYEIALCICTDSELEALTLAEMVDSLCMSIR